MNGVKKTPEFGAMLLVLVLFTMVNRGVVATQNVTLLFDISAH